MDLPIFNHSDKILESLRTHNRVLLNAPTGSGKSTGIPPLLYKEGIIEGKILVVQPRRLAARLLAQRVASTLGVKLGAEIGYSVRFDSKQSAQTKILFLTDGLLLRLIQENPTLDGIGLIIFDEFHERRVASDVALGICKDLQAEARKDLSVLVMSATLSEESLGEYLAPCEKINAEGRSYPVEILHRTPVVKNHPRTGRPETPPMWDQIKAISKEAVSQEDSGNWLIFLPGMHEIRKTIEALQSASWLRDFQIYPLHSTLPPKKQLEAIESDGPKIIVSTNVAETSLTINGIKTVIDTGVARESRYDTNRDMDSLLIRKISKASATQRAGRAGRTAPGLCYRLWSENDHSQREDFQAPEILTIDISPTVLLLTSLGYPEEFPWLDSPSEEALKTAYNLLSSLGAIHKGSLTEIGKTISKLPLPPRLARLLLAGEKHDCLPETLFVSALLQGEPLVRRTAGIKPAGRPSRNQNPLADFEDKNDPSSFAGLFAAYHYVRSNQFSPQAAKPFGISLRATRELEKTAQQLQQLLKSLMNNQRLLSDPDFHSRAPQVAQAIAETFPEKLCLRLGEGTLSARLLNDKKGKLEDCTTARRGRLFFATQSQEVQGRDVLTHLSGLVQVEPEQLREWFPEKFSQREQVILDDATNKIVSQQAISYTHQNLSLVIEKKISSTPPAEDLVATLIAEMIHKEEVKLPKWDHNVEQWIARLNQLSEWMPELELPKITEEDKFTILEELCQGISRVKEVKPLDPWPVLNDWLSPIQAEALRSYAPSEITLSNGKKAKITYAEAEPPTIAMQLQRLYDVTETPTLCNGTIPIRVQILAPNQRPWQTTSDLPNFWRSGYEQMKKDLAGRYPKHEWR